jgi:hypothetical protein
MQSPQFLERELHWGDGFLEDSLLCSLTALGMSSELTVRWHGDDAERVESSWVDTVFMCAPHGLKTEYFLSWLLHFSNCAGRLRRVSETFFEYELLVTRIDNREEMTPLSRVFSETTGPSCEKIKAHLEASPLVSVDGTDIEDLLTRIAAAHSISLLISPHATARLRKMKDKIGPVVVDPFRTQQVEAKIPVVVPENARTIRQVLTLVMPQVGLTFRVQGGVVYICCGDSDLGPALENLDSQARRNEP